MGPVLRGVRNAFRNPLRSIAVVVILSISIGLSVTMLLARQAVIDKAAALTSEVGTTITVSPAGSFGFEGGGEPLTATQFTQLKALGNVSSVSGTLSDRLTTDENTNLQPGIDAGTLGTRRIRQGRGESGGVTITGEAPPAGAATFKLPVQVTGVTGKALPSDATLSAGSDLSESSTGAVALVGSALATKNSLSVGSAFTMYGQNVTVQGIYTTDNQFNAAGLYVPAAFLQTASSQVDQFTSFTVTANSAANVESVTSAVKSALGTAADVTASLDEAKATIAPLTSIERIATLSAIGALIAAAIITFFSMAMVVRERRREIGVLKAIGASNTAVITQFVVESAVLVLIAAVIGTLAGALLGNPVLKSLLDSSLSSVAGTTTTIGGPPGGFSGAIRAGGAAVFSAGGARQSISDLSTSIGLNVLGYGALAALLVATLGSAIPAWLTARVRPAEVLRGE